MNRNSVESNFSLNLTILGLLPFFSENFSLFFRFYYFVVNVQIRKARGHDKHGEDEGFPSIHVVFTLSSVSHLIFPSSFFITALDQQSESIKMVVGEAQNGATDEDQTQVQPMPPTQPLGIQQATIDNIMSGIENTGAVKMNNHRKKLRQRWDDDNESYFIVTQSGLAMMKRRRGVIKHVSRSLSRDIEHFLLFLPTSLPDSTSSRNWVKERMEKCN